MEMVNLEENHRCIYDDFMKGNFSVQMWDNNIFGRLEADKVIQTNSINKDTKTPGGTTGMIFVRLEKLNKANNVNACWNVIGVDWMPNHGMKLIEHQWNLIIKTKFIFNSD